MDCLYLINHDLYLILIRFDHPFAAFPLFLNADLENLRIRVNYFFSCFQFSFQYSQNLTHYSTLIKKAYHFFNLYSYSKKLPVYFANCHLLKMTAPNNCFIHSKNFLIFYKKGTSFHSIQYSSLKIKSRSTFEPEIN